MNSDASTTRDYDCGGASSTSCTTYMVPVRREGGGGGPPFVLATDTTFTGGFFAARSEIFVTFHSRGAFPVPPVRVRSFSAAGDPGAVDTTILEPLAEEVVTAVRGGEHGDEIVWVYNSSVGGVRMLVTSRDAKRLRGPYSLRGFARVPDEQTFLILDGVAHVLFDNFSAPGGLRLGRWTLCGEPIGTSTPIDPSAGWGAHAVLSESGAQIYVADRSADGVGAVRLARVARTGEILQPAVELATGQDGLGVAATPDGVIVAWSNYGGGIVTWAKYGCPE